MDSLAARITEELRVLIGRPLADCWRAADMAIFDFGPTRRITGRNGDRVEVGDVALHVQCRWRFVDGTRILFGRDDLGRPADDPAPARAFDPDKEDSALDVARRRWFEGRRDARSNVVAVRGDAYGGFWIGLDGGLAIEAFPCDSRRGGHSEHWRLRGHRADGGHFVVTGDGVEGDGPSSADTA